MLQLRLQKASLSLSSRYSRRLVSRNSTLSGHFSSLYLSKACRYAESRGISSCCGKLRKLYFSYCARTQKEKQNKRNASLRQCDEEAMVPYVNPKVHRSVRAQDPPAPQPLHVPKVSQNTPFPHETTKTLAYSDLLKYIHLFVKSHR